MYLRFTSTAVDESSRKRRGVFQEAIALLNSGMLDKEDRLELRAAMDWFDANLDAPPKSFLADRAVFWFRSDAHDCIDQMWTMVRILRKNDHHVVVHKCRHLANISYRDKLQVAAYPSDLDDRIIEH